MLARVSQEMTITISPMAVPAGEFTDKPVTNAPRPLTVGAAIFD